MPDAALTRRRHVWGVLASSALVLAAHASVLEWAWHGGGYASSAVRSPDGAVIGATLLPVAPASAPVPPAAPASSPASTSNRSNRTNPPRTAAAEPTSPASASYATATATATAADASAEPVPSTEAHKASATTASNTNTNTGTGTGTADTATAPEPPSAASTHSSADTQAGANPEAASPLPADVQLAAAHPDDTRPPPASAATAHLPPPGSWHYQVHGQAKGLSYQAEGQLHWQHDGQHYRAHMAVRALWLQRTQTSTGRLGPTGLQPEHFIDQARKTRETWFDPQQHTLRTGSGTPQPAPVGVQDRLSVFFQLATQLNRAAAGRTPARSTWPIPVAGGADSETWHFEPQGHEALTLPAGAYDTVKLTRQPRHASDQTVEVWLAPALHHIPVRLRIRQGNGDVVDQQLSGVAAAPRP